RVTLRIGIVGEDTRGDGGERCGPRDLVAVVLRHRALVSTQEEIVRGADVDDTPPVVVVGAGRAEVVCRLHQDGRQRRHVDRREGADEQRDGGGHVWGRGGRPA